MVQRLDGVGAQFCVCSVRQADERQKLGQDRGDVGAKRRAQVTGNLADHVRRHGLVLFRWREKIENGKAVATMGKRYRGQRDRIRTLQVVNARLQHTCKMDVLTLMTRPSSSDTSPMSLSSLMSSSSASESAAR